MIVFQVPQFIDEKPKIAGPLTLRQLLYLAGAAGISVAVFYVFNLFLWAVITALVGAVAVSFAFVKIEGREMSKVFLAGLAFMWRPRVYVWRRETPETTIDTEALERLLDDRRRAGLQEQLKAVTAFVTTKKSRSAAAIAGEQKRNKERYEAVRYITGETETAKRVDYK